jgi:hypothetical protein
MSLHEYVMYLQWLCLDPVPAHLNFQVAACSSAVPSGIAGRMPFR